MNSRVKILWAGSLVRVWLHSMLAPCSCSLSWPYWTLQRITPADGKQILHSYDISLRNGEC